VLQSPSIIIITFVCCSRSSLSSTYLVSFRCAESSISLAPAQFPAVSESVFVDEFQPLSPFESPFTLLFLYAFQFLVFCALRVA